MEIKMYMKAAVFLLQFLHFDNDVGGKSNTEKINTITPVLHMFGSFSTPDHGQSEKSHVFAFCITR